MFTNDYIMRQIEMLSNVIRKVFFQRVEMNDEPINYIFSGENLDTLDAVLDAHIASGEFAKAEDELFAYMEKHPSERAFESAIAFFSRLNAFSDAELRRGNFSRDEISKGITDITKLVDRLSE